MDPWQGNKLIIPSRPYVRMEERKSDQVEAKVEDIRNVGKVVIEEDRIKIARTNLISESSVYNRNPTERFQIWDDIPGLGYDEVQEGWGMNVMDPGANYEPPDFYPVIPKMQERLENEFYKVLDGNEKIDKIKIPERDYTKPAPAAVIQPLELSLETESNQNNVFTEIKLSFDIIRQNIELNLDNKIKAAIEDALSELKNIDIIERNLCAKIVQGPVPIAKEYKLKSKAYNLIINEMNIESGASSINIPKKEADIPKKAKMTKAQKKINKKMEELKLKAEKTPEKLPQKNLISDSIIELKEVSIPKHEELIKANIINQIPASVKISNNIPASTPLLVSFNSSTLTYSTNLITTEKIAINNLSKDMNCLVLDNDNILFAGGVKKSVFSYCISTKAHVILPNLLYPHRFFGLSFIGDVPAVIGGIVDNKVVDTVELFENFGWKKINSLKIPRSHCSAIKHKNFTYVFGGISSEINTFVERYDKDWFILRIKALCGGYHFGIASNENFIFIFGGKEKNKEEKKSGGKNECLSVHKYDVKRMGSVTLRGLNKSFCSMNTNSAVLNNGIIYLLDGSDSSIVNYIIST